MRHALSSFKRASMAAVMVTSAFGVSLSNAAPEGLTSGNPGLPIGSPEREATAYLQFAEVLQPNIFFEPIEQQGEKQRKKDRKRQEKIAKQRAREEAQRSAARAANEPEIQEAELAPLTNEASPALNEQAALEQPRVGQAVAQQPEQQTAQAGITPQSLPQIQTAVPQIAARIETPTEQPTPQADARPQGYEYTPYVPNRQVVPATAPSAQAMPSAERTIAPGGTLTVALLTPNSDPRPGVKALAESLTKAAALAAQEIGDRRLILRGYDTAGTPERAVIAAEQALADGAQLIIGPLFANNAIAVSNVVQPYGVSTISFTTDRTVLRRGLYSLGYLPETEIERMIGFSARQGIGRMAVLAPETAYGNLVYAEVQNAALRHGVDILRFQSFRPVFDAMDQTATDFASFYDANSQKNEEEELIEPAIDGLMLAASGKSLQALAAYLAFRDVLPSDVKYMGLGLWDNPETFREATLRGGWFPGVDPLLRSEFEAAYTQSYGGEPSAIAGLGYDAVIVAASLIEAASPNLISPFSINAIERPMGFKGMSGTFRFLGDGRNDRQLSVLRVGRKEFDVLDPAPVGFQSQTEFGGLRQ